MKVRRDNFEYVLPKETEAQKEVHICDGLDYYMLCGLFRYKQIWVETNKPATCKECIQIVKERGKKNEIRETQTKRLD